MHRTPQPTLTQSKLTGFTKRAENPALPSEPMDTGGVTATRPSTSRTPFTSVPAEAADNQRGVGTAGGVAATATNMPPGPSPFITTDFLLKALKENTDQIVKLFSSNLGALAQRVEDNASSTSDNSAAIMKHGTSIEHGSALASLTSRVVALERGNLTSIAMPTQRGLLSREFLFARRLVRLWQVPGTNHQDMWGNVGEFLHDTLRIPENELGQKDIEKVTKTRIDALQDRVRDEVCVRFLDKRKRDVVFSQLVRQI